MGVLYTCKNLCTHCVHVGTHNLNVLHTIKASNTLEKTCTSVCVTASRGKRFKPGVSPVVSSSFCSSHAKCMYIHTYVHVGTNNQ